MIQCLSLSTMKPVKMPEKMILCLGTFDGVHTAHRALIHQAIKLRALRHQDAACGVFCFSPPPSDILCPKHAPEHLSSTEEKLLLLASLGADYACLADFGEMKELSPKAFAQHILKDTCHCVAAVCGFNHRFGKGASGTAQELQALLNSPVYIQPKIEADEKTVSSSYIRKLLKDGEPALAAKLLGRPYSITSTVLHGKALGRTWGYPTVNQAFPIGKLIPRRGVYVTECTLEDGSIRRGVTNIGTHPTVDRNATPNCETHLLGFDGDLYGTALQVSFLHYIRPEQKFATEEALQKQIAKDLQIAAAY